MKTLANEIIEILQNEGTNGELGSIRMPFVHGFPKNCCEIASYYFAAIAVDKFPNKKIDVVTGKYCHGDSNSVQQENHTWVLVEGQIYDLTAHQFSEQSKPVLGDDLASPQNWQPEETMPAHDAYAAWDGYQNKDTHLAFIQSKLQRAREKTADPCRR